MLITKHIYEATIRIKDRTRTTEVYLKSFMSVMQCVWVLHPAERKAKFGRAWNDVNYVMQPKSESKLITVHMDH